MHYPAKPECDLHTHTVASGHAFSTVGEIATEAGSKGLRLVGITDHGPGMPGAPHPYHFAAMRFMPEILHGVRLLRGVEANVIGQGEIDLSEDQIARLDLVMVGLHDECGFDDRGMTANTDAVLSLMEHPKVKVIAHPGNPDFPLDYEAVARAGVATSTALEINNSSFIISRKGSAGNCLEMARHCARFGSPVTIGSDAHIAQGVGEFDEALRLLAEAGVAWEQVVSRTLESTLAFLDLSR